MLIIDGGVYKYRVNPLNKGPLWDNESVLQCRLFSILKQNYSVPYIIVVSFFSERSL